MKAHWDVSCQKCKKKFGWYGTIYDAPPCPKCGAKYDVASLENDLKIIKEAKEEGCLH